MGGVNGSVLQHACSALQEDYEVALTALLQNDSAFQYISPELRRQEHFKKEVSRCCPRLLKAHGHLFNFAELNKEQEVLLQDLVDIGSIMRERLGTIFVGTFAQI